MRPLTGLSQNGYPAATLGQGHVLDYGAALSQHERMPIGKIEGLALQVGVADMAEALAFYGKLFGREPDFAAAEDFQEYETATGVWFQITTGLEPGRICRVRFGVPDVGEARLRLLAEGFAVGELETLPGIVSYCDFCDPWGNLLGLYQDLAEPYA